MPLSKPGRRLALDYEIFCAAAVKSAFIVIMPDIPGEGWSRFRILSRAGDKFMKVTIPDARDAHSIKFGEGAEDAAVTHDQNRAGL